MVRMITRGPSTHHVAEERLPTFLVQRVEPEGDVCRVLHGVGFLPLAAGPTGEFAFQGGDPCLRPRLLPL